jgi:uncharacterized protein (UPF0332 family)
MAELKVHKELAAKLLAAAKKSDPEKEWPITVDAAFYAVFHSMEALNAADCRDSYTFGDADDMLTYFLTDELGAAFAKRYRYGFYFRRGVIYGPHFPTVGQVKKFLRSCEEDYAHVLSVLERRESSIGVA